MTTLPQPLFGKALQSHLDSIHERGYAILENAVDTQFLSELTAEIERLESVRPGGDIPPALFTGQVTRRWFDLLNEAEIWQSVAAHPWVLQIQEKVLGDGFLLSTMGTAVVGSGEGIQPIHADDSIYGFPRPHPTIVCNTVWAISDFTETNGATRLVPGSHRWDEDPDLWEPYSTIPAEMPAGSICVFVGTLYHGAGANNGSADRLGLTVNYCSGALRQQENLMLGISRERLMSFPEKLQDILGMKMKAGLGHIFAQDPREELNRQLGSTAEKPSSERRNDFHQVRLAAHEAGLEEPTSPGL